MQPPCCEPMKDHNQANHFGSPPTLPKANPREHRNTRVSAFYTTTTSEKIGMK